VLEANGLLGLSRSIGRYQQLGVHAFYQGFKVKDEESKFISVIPVDEGTFKYRHYAGLRFDYSIMKLDNHVIPTRGIGFNSEVSVTQPFDNAAEGFARVGGNFGFYIPLFGNLVFASKAGAAAMSSGEQPFYQMNRLGGASTFRGYSRWRFYGQHMFYNNNELQYNIPFKSWIMNGTFGLLLLYDNGRVWHPNEVSNTWHHTFGAGIMLAPFNKATIVATYGDGKDDARINIRVGRLF
jgi:hemolysin activation/secretion protein